MTDHTRQSALNILTTLEGSHLTLDTIMNDFYQDNRTLIKRDLALINALVYGVVRWRSRLDHIIGHFSQTPLKKIKPEILNILRLGVFQITMMSRIPDSAAVNTSVELAKKNGPVWITKYVNGVLRNVARKHESVPFPEFHDNKTLSLSLSHSFPTWLVQKWLNRFGDEEAIRLCTLLNTVPPISVRANTLKTNRSALAEALSPHVKELVHTHYCEQGLTFSHPDQSVSQLPGFAEGWFQVQDEAAQLIGDLVCPRPGERIFDACAGLGGKTGHLAQLMENQGEILAMDFSKNKLFKLEQDMKRLGVSIVKTMAADLEYPLSKDKLGTFDKILLDAPCSGLGVIRRNPDSKWSVSKKNLNRYKKRQIRFLNHVAGLLKPSGMIVFAVCSTEPEENEAVIDSFLHAHPYLSVKTDVNDLSGPIKDVINARGFFVSLPHKLDMDGFFAARLVQGINASGGPAGGQPFEKVAKHIL